MSDSYHERYNNDLITEIKSKKYEYYHKPKIECDIDGYMCRCCKPTIITHPLKHISPYIKDYNKLVWTSIVYNGNSLSCASSDFLDDENYVLCAVEQAGGALQYASGRLQNSKKLVIVAVTQWGKALQFASYNLRSNKEVVIAALSNKYGGLRYASDELRQDRDIVTYAMLFSNGYAFYYAAPCISNYCIIKFIQEQIEYYYTISDNSNIMGYSNKVLIKKLMDIKKIS